MLVLLLLNIISIRFRFVPNVLSLVMLKKLMKITK